MTASRVVEGKAAEREGLVKMLVELARARRLTPPDFERGLLPLLEFLEDVAVDVPQAYDNLGDALGPFLLENCVGVHWVLETARRFRLPVAKVACAALDSVLAPRPGRSPATSATRTSCGQATFVPARLRPMHSWLKRITGPSFPT
ncbi:unnamed protein product [Heterosigma akashiwo]